MGNRGPSRAGLATIALTVLTLLATASTAAARYPVSYDFGRGMFAQGQHPDSPPPGANDWSCRPSQAHPRPVILVHGLAANQTVNWQTISPVLANQGYCVFSLTYGTKPNAVLPGYRPGGLTTMEASAKELGRFVERVRRVTDANRVDIVGHSEGSLMPAWYVKFLGGYLSVRNYVGITTLWHGTNFAGAGTLYQLGRGYGFSQQSAQLVAQQCDSCPEFVAGSDFIKKLRAGGVMVAGVRYTSIVTRNDELVVPYTSGIEPGMTNLIVQQQCPLDQGEHQAMAADPIVAQDILNALDPRHPGAVPCTPVLPFVGAPAYTGPPR
ncbi:MAG: esterase/lipase family protein [Solirubrobacterales bacterium]